MRQQTCFVFLFLFKVRQPANQRPSSSWGLFDKTIYKQFPKRTINMCKQFTSAFKCSYKCSLSNSNFNSHFGIFQTVAFRLPQTINKSAQTYLFALAFLSVVLVVQPNTQQNNYHLQVITANRCSRPILFKLIMIKNCNSFRLLSFLLGQKLLILHK